MLKTAELYDMSHTLAGAYLSGFEYPWQALKGIKELILALGPTLGEDYTEVSPTVWVHKTAAVAPTAFLGDAVAEVKPSTRLKSHPVCLTAGEGLSFEMEKPTAWWAIPWS